MNTTPTLAESEKSLLSIRQARDAALSRVHELTVKLAAAEDRIAVLGDEYDSAVRAREAAENTEDSSRREREELRRKSEDLRRTVLDLNNQRVTFLEAETNTAAELSEARKQMAVLAVERDHFRVELEAERGRGQGKEVALDELNQAKVELATLKETFERFKAQQKKSVADLAEHTASAHRSRDAAVANVIKVQARVDELKSELAAQRKLFAEDRTMLEAQIFALQAQAGTPAPVGPEAGEADASAGPVKQVHPDKIVTPLRTPSVPKVQSFAVGEAASAVARLAAGLDRIVQEPSKSALLDELAADLHEFNERAHAGNLAALEAGSAACLDVVRWLHKAPAKLPSVMPCLVEVIALLDGLAALQPGPGEFANPAGAGVYAVDDDVDNCECIAMALEKLKLQTQYATKPELALAQLTATPVGLIVLDVDMPGMDGFELYDRLRKIPHHAETPVVFLSGLISTQERLRELPPANLAFLAKPYNLTVLGLKAMNMILRSRLTVAESMALPTPRAVG